jgi:hypothetical protein
MKNRKEFKMTASLKTIVIFTTVTFLAITGLMISPLTRDYYKNMDLSSFYPENSIVFLYQNKTFHNQTGNTLNKQIADTRFAPKETLVQKLKTLGYNERFINLLNDHSLIALARKEGLTVKDWRI